MKDVLSTTLDRLKQLRLVSLELPVLECLATLQRRSSSASCIPPCKAIPIQGLVNGRPWSSLASSKDWELIEFWTFGAFRENELLGINREAVSMAKYKGEDWVKAALPITKSTANVDYKYLPARCARSFYSLPFRRQRVDELLARMSRTQFGMRHAGRNPLALSPHSFRRSLAMSLRQGLNDRGFTSKQKLGPLLHVIDLFFTWAPGSKMFFTYSDDFQSYPRSIPVPEVTAFILSECGL